MKATVAMDHTDRHRAGRMNRCALCERAWPCPVYRKQRRSHLVARVRFVSGVPADLAAVACTCGWAGTVGLWDAHRAVPRPVLEA